MAANDSTSSLSEEVVTVHHGGLRRELQEVGELLDSVLRVHAIAYPELRALAPAFAGLRDELEAHLARQERLLFPAYRTPDPAGTGAIAESLRAVHEHGHDQLDDALAALRGLTGGYDADRAVCRTHRRLLEALQALELDIHQHVHEKADILLAQLRARPRAATGGSIR